jgi:hypothetical protein
MPYNANKHGGKAWQEPTRAARQFWPICARVRRPTGDTRLSARPACASPENRESDDSGIALLLPGADHSFTPAGSRCAIGRQGNLERLSGRVCHLPRPLNTVGVRLSLNTRGHAAGTKRSIHGTVMGRRTNRDRSERIPNNQTSRGSIANRFQPSRSRARSLI